MQRKVGDGLRLSYAVPKIQWDSNPALPLRLLSNEKPLPFRFPEPKAPGELIGW